MEDDIFPKDSGAEIRVKVVDGNNTWFLYGRGTGVVIVGAGADGNGNRRRYVRHNKLL